jgi:prolyl-tRNA synthetase
VGPRDIAADQLPVARRDRPHKEVTKWSRQEVLATILQTLDEIQDGLFAKALKFQKDHTHVIDSKEEFYAFFTPKNSENPEIHAGFALTHWCDDPQVEEKIKQDLGVTVRCIPLDFPKEEGRCPFSGKKSACRVVWGKSY